MNIDSNSFKRIIDSLHDGLYFVDLDRKILYWNKAAEKISGYSAEEVVGKSCYDNILTHVDTEGVSLCMGLCPLAASISDRQPREAEVYMHHKCGHRIPVSVRVSALTDASDNVIGDEVLKFIANTFVTNSRPFDSFGRWGGEEFIGIIRNTTNRELEEIGNRLRLLVENAYILPYKSKTAGRNRLTIDGDV